MSKIIKASVTKMPPGTWTKFMLHMRTEHQEKHSYTPFEGTLIYVERRLDNGHVLYFANDPITGDVSFFAHHAKDSSGFCGHTFKLPVIQEDYSIKIKEVKGPWSSACSSMNSYGFPKSVEVHFDGSLSGHFSLVKANEVLKEFNLPYHYAPYRDWNGREESDNLVLHPNKGET